ncbi:MAG TPA: hypothetical protein VK886_03680 [Vicinamibacterales bacterium]|nr:hypothetical protein [Vicinamibacterales bacterium]
MMVSPDVALMAAPIKDFPLDPAILADDSASAVAVGPATRGDVIAAIVANAPFPPGPIELGQIALESGTGGPIAFKAGEARVAFDSSAALRAGAGVFDSAAEALAPIQAESPQKIDLKIPAPPGSRWAALRWAHSATGKFSGSHPLGAIGAATFGVEGKRHALYAVLHRFDAAAGARDVLETTLRSWRLPRQVDAVAGEVNLAPGTWIVAEADGSLALPLGARLGFDVSFAHESTVLGRTRDLGVKLDANLRAALGLSVSGRYLIVVGRENKDATVRLRVYKQSKKGLNFGLNLNVGVKAAHPLPKRFDDFVQAVFGVHGSQVLADLHVVEQWVDPATDLGETVARLVARTALELLRRVTGLDPETSFDEARAIVAGALEQWRRLPDDVAAMIWQFLSHPPDAVAVERFKAWLRALAGADAVFRRAALADALRDSVFGDSAEADWLEAIADAAPAVVGEDRHDADVLSALARDTLAVLDDPVIWRLHEFISKRLDLSPLRAAVRDEDFEALEDWLVRRLADLINAKVPLLQDLKEIQEAISAIDAKVRSIYENGVKALSARYAAEFAAVYQETRTDTALLDVSFDLSVASGLDLFRRVARDGNFDELLARPAEGVTLHEAALTHRLRRRSRVELRLPFIGSNTTRVTDSLARLSVEEDAGRILLYQFAASDKVHSANRVRSELSVLGGVRTDAEGLPRLASRSTVAYEARHVKRGMRPPELERRTRPFIETYLSSLFAAGDASLRGFYADLDASASAALQNPSNYLGDVAWSTRVAYPVRVLEAWLLPRDAAAVRRDSMRLSRAVQAALRRLLARTYFEDVGRFQVTEPVAALLVWSSMPVSTSVDAHALPVRFNTDTDLFWDYARLEERRAVARDPYTAAALAAALEDARERLREEGRDRPDRFGRAWVGQFIELALDATGDRYLASLLNAEARIIAGAASALGKIAGVVRQMRTAPATVVQTLSDFAAALVDTFSGRLQFVYSREAVRSLGPTILAEASAAIHPAVQFAAPDAMLRLFVLAADRRFVLETFLDGEVPPLEEVALAQTLTVGT